MECCVLQVPTDTGKKQNVWLQGFLSLHVHSGCIADKIKIVYVYVTVYPPICSCVAYSRKILRGLKVGKNGLKWLLVNFEFGRL